MFFSLKMANILGFRSASAQSYCRKATDHHRSWDMIHVAFNGTLDELLVPYVRHCLFAKEQTSAEHFKQWSRSVVNPNYKLMLCNELHVSHYIVSFWNPQKQFKNNAVCT